MLCEIWKTRSSILNTLNLDLQIQYQDIPDEYFLAYT